MMIWIVLGCVVLALALLLLVPVRAKASYSQEGVRLALALGPITVPVVPRPAKRPKKKKKQPKEPKETPQPEREKTKNLLGNLLNPGSWKKFRRYLPLICEVAGELRRKIIVRKLKMHLIWAGKDPASAAIGYGMINGVIGGIWTLIDGNFRVKDHKFVVDLDYDKKEPQVSAQAELSLTVGQCLSFALRYIKKLAAIKAEEGGTTQHSKEVNSHERTKASH